MCKAGLRRCQVRHVCGVEVKDLLGWSLHVAFQGPDALDPDVLCSDGLARRRPVPTRHSADEQDESEAVVATYPNGYICRKKYQVEQTGQFVRWIAGLKDMRARIAIARRIERIAAENRAMPNQSAPACRNCASP